MIKKLWFLTDGIKPIDVYESEKDAHKDYLKYEDDSDFQYYEYYELDVNELEDYPNEYDLALEEGYI